MKKALFCPICQNHKVNFLFYKNRQSYFECLVCNLKFIWPMPQEKKLRQYYQNNYWHRKIYRGQENALGYLNYSAEKDSLLRYFYKILHLIKEKQPNLSGRVLDIGCGWGYFLMVCQKLGLEIYGLDLSPESVEKTKKFLGINTVYQQDLLDKKFPKNYFDLVTLFQVIEHLKDPERLLNEVKRILKPGGYFVISTPDNGGFQARMMKSSWFSFRHPDHLLFFNEDNLRLLLKTSGFTKTEMIKDPAREYTLNYLLENIKFYFKNIYILRVADLLLRILVPLGKIRISIPLGSLVLLGQKKDNYF